jgi:hypothetical protein
MRPQAVDDEHIVAAGDECIGEVRSNEARSTGNDDTHNREKFATAGDPPRE